ncbi:MAG: hypothetical protein D4R45_04490 [Planctomycetaceae bacterium]|nr:MAG: hypothetical protein D4R45_04490 [Planctomycetaceae bacterium]
MNTRIKTDTKGEPLSKDEVFNFIKFEDTSNTSEIALIMSMIASVRTHFERRTGLSFMEKTYETLFKIDDKPFVLPIQPIISVDKVELVDQYGEKTELTLDTDYYKRGLYEIEIFTSSMAGWTNPLTSFSGYYDLFVTYKAGYGHGDTETLPFDLRDAMMKQIKQWYDNRDDFYEFKILGSIEKILNTYKTRLF